MEGIQPPVHLATTVLPQLECVFPEASDNWASMLLLALCLGKARLTRGVREKTDKQTNKQTQSKTTYLQYILF